MRGVWLASIGLMFAWPLWAAGPGAAIPVLAVWKEQRLDFSYMGRTARYSCEGLRDKMRSLLLDLGARRDLQVAVLACNESEAQPLRRGYVGPRLSIVFSSPILPDAAVRPLPSPPLTPQQVADVEKLVNERILENAGVSWIEVSYADVKSRKDVMQFFGDKYGELVRVVQIVAGIDGKHARIVLGARRVDAHDLGVGVRAPHERGVDGADLTHVVDVRRAAGDQTRIFAAPDARE